MHFIFVDEVVRGKDAGIKSGLPQPLRSSEFFRVNFAHVPTRAIYALRYGMFWSSTCMLSKCRL